ncbi:MAG TPA: ATP-binding cassette domain-containing protein [Gammaproteobacteria bacterium]|nr:ATP-binding cassette domain-containing protein [Gammaproteobacteria bacterium]
MLQFSDLALRRGPRLLFEHATFQIHPGQRVGVTGANGTGKSSLFALILGELQPDAGEFRLPRDWVIAHVAQETPVDPRPALEYVLDGDTALREVERALVEAEAAGDGERLARLHGRFEAIDGYSARSRAAQLLHGLGFGNGDQQRPVSDFSGGWRMRLNLGRALMCRSDLLLLDEPTNHLDLDAVIWLENWLRSYAGTLLLISHDRDFLDSVSNRVLHFEQQRLTLYSGNYSAFERVRAERLASRQAEYEKQQREIAHMHAFVERFRAKATKARQAQSRLKALQRMERIAPAHVDSPFHFSIPAPARLPHPLLQLEGVAGGYGDQPVVAGVDLGLFPGDRIGLLGTNGAGKSTLIKLLAGVLAPQRGRLECSKDLRIGYFAQHQVEQLQPQHSPLEHLRQLDADAREQPLRDFLGGFGFSGDRATAPVAPFSGGEKSRLALALLAWQRPNLLLLDEPTNHLDLEMRQALAVALQEFAGAMVMVSHDRHLLRVACDRLLRVHDGRVDEFPGSLDDYPRWLAEQGRQPRPAPGETVAHSASARRQRKREQAEQRRRLQPLRQRIRAAEDELERLQARQAEIEQQLADPALYADDRKARLKELLLEKAGLDDRCSRLEEDWMQASEELESLRAS